MDKKIFKIDEYVLLADRLFNVDSYDCLNLVAKERSLNKEYVLWYSYYYLADCALFYAKYRKSSQQDDTTNFKNLLRKYFEWKLLCSPLFNFDTELLYRKAEEGDYHLEKKNVKGTHVCTAQNPIPSDCNVVDTEGNVINTRENLTLIKHNPIDKIFNVFFDNFMKMAKKENFTIHDTVFLAEGMMLHYGNIFHMKRDFNGNAWDENPYDIKEQMTPEDFRNKYLF